MLTGQDVAETGHSKHLLGGVHGFGDPIAEKDERVFRLEFQAGGDVLGSGHETNRIRAFRERLGDLAAPQEEGRGTPWSTMTGQ